MSSQPGTRRASGARLPTRVGRGRSLISGSEDGTIRVWSIDEETTERRHHARFIRAAPHGDWEVRQVAFGLTVEVAHESGESWAPIENDLTLRVAEFDREGRTVALGFERGVVQIGALPSTASAGDAIMGG